MLSSLLRAEGFLRALAANPAAFDLTAANALADALAAHRSNLVRSLGLDTSPDGSSNGLGERGSAARGAEPRLLLDWSSARVVCQRTGKVAALSSTPELTHYVTCTCCKKPAHVANLRREAVLGVYGEPSAWPSLSDAGSRRRRAGGAA